MIEEKELLLVSVVVPCYNHEKYVKETIESIINQTYKNIELIVIDDGSKDGSVKVIQELADRYGFTFIHRPNKGLTKTLNEGVHLASGDFIAFVASDDYWDITKIEKQVESFNKNDKIVMSFTEGYEINQFSEINGVVKYTESRKTFYNFQEILLYASLPSASIMVRKEELLKVGGFSEDLKVEDLDIWLKLLKDGGLAEVLHEKLMYYRIHDNNTHANDLMITREHFKIISRYLYLVDIKTRKKVLNEWALRNANILARRNKREALLYFRNCLFSLNDLRLYKILFKLLFLWKNK